MLNMRVVRLMAILSFMVVAAEARILSYAPYSDRASYPLAQSRMNRHFGIVEGHNTALDDSLYIDLTSGPPIGQLVIYDSKGLDEPRVVYPQDGTLENILFGAIRETGDLPTILIETTGNLHGQNPQHQLVFLLSTDGGP